MNTKEAPRSLREVLKMRCELSDFRRGHCNLCKDVIRLNENGDTSLCRIPNYNYVLIFKNSYCQSRFSGVLTG
jgi:hypothetical protein